MILNVMYIFSIQVNWLIINIILHWHSLIQLLFHNVYIVVEVSAIVPRKNEGNWHFYSRFSSVKNCQIASNIWHKNTEDIMSLKWTIFKDKKSDEKSVTNSCQSELNKYHEVTIWQSKKDTSTGMCNSIFNHPV